MKGLKGEDREERILAGKLDLLFRGHIAVPGNMLAALVVAFLLRQSYPSRFLIAWLAATAFVGASRLLLHRAFRNASAERACHRCWAQRFTIGTFCSGALWGTLCGGLALWGTHRGFVLLSFVAGGMTAGALATFAPYMPAYLAYAAPFILPLSVASLLNPDEVIAGNGILILFYFAVVTLTCRYSSRFVNSTVELQVDNEILRGHLRSTRRERDRARTEKWSTLAQLSHELRTPLNAIMGFSEAMRDEVLGVLGNRRYKDYASHIHASGRQLLRLSDELMLISQGESGAMALKEEVVNTAELIASLVAQKSEAAEKAGLRLSHRIASALPCLKSDRDKCRTMLRHLLENALKFTPAGGQIAVVAIECPDGAVSIAVEDSGIGIEAADIPRALRPFGRVATALTHTVSGAGLGLPIAARIAELHGAKFSLHSTPGQGTRVVIVFPAERSLSPKAGNAVAAA